MMDENQSFTIADFAEKLDKRSPRDWFRWPPDLFALTSYVLRTTGLYSVLLDGQVIEDDPRYARCRSVWRRITSLRTPAVLNALVDEWHDWLLKDTENTPLPPRLDFIRQILFSDAARVTRTEARHESTTWTTRPAVVGALLSAHAVADAACRGFGLMSAPRNHRALIRFFANYHLVFDGSCSLLPPWSGVVLPKTRTPQRGLSTRSFSHHLTFHQSEVRVRWRAIPWVNQDNSENTAHAVLVPTPYVVKPEDFRPAQNPDAYSDFLGFEYFEYVPQRGGVDVDGLVRVLKEAYQEVRTVHLVVFPELALTHGELKQIQERLWKEFYPEKQMPVIIAGLRTEWNHVDDPSAEAAEAPADGAGEAAPRERPVNKVTLSAFFAGKWYDVGQHKHHRWRLDAPQIRQYSLEGVLNPQRLWWERIRLSPRALTIVAPNEWLTICPLICEDLAQIEPVSEIIRGVGPTLVPALLMDGPQLEKRWPSRYVGVLADDPGTSILTLTSLGMAQRSQASGYPTSSAVALWKDQTTGGAESLVLAPDARAILVTMNAIWTEEFTADNRSDESSASILKLQSFRQIRVPDEAHEPQLAAAKPYHSTLEDTEELSVLSFLVDSIIDAPLEHVEMLCRCVLNEEDAPPPGTLGEVWSRTRTLIAQRYTGGNAWPRAEFKGAVLNAYDFMLRASSIAQPDAALRTARDSSLVSLVHYWKELGRLAVFKFSPEGLSYAERAPLLAFELILWALHNRFSKAKRDLLRARVPATASEDMDRLYGTSRGELRDLQILINSTGYEDPPPSVLQVRNRWYREGEALVARSGRAPNSLQGVVDVLPLLRTAREPLPAAPDGEDGTAVV
jgi:hypothetical protein